MKAQVTIKIQRGDYEYESDYTVDEEAAMASNPYTTAIIERSYLGPAYDIIDDWMQRYLMGQIRKELGREP
jgi:hypothetical protein